MQGLMADAAGGEGLLYYLVLPLGSFLVVTLGLAFAARPAWREWKKERGDERDFKENLGRLLFGEEADPKRGVWKKTPGLDERVTDIQTRIDRQLGKNGEEPLISVTKAIREKLDEHCNNQTIHIHKGDVGGS